MYQRFAGILDVSDDEFVLVVKDLRVFERDRVTFEFTGEDDGGPFSCSGSAKFSSSSPSFYVAQVKLIATRPQVATIRFKKVKVVGDECLVEASWTQDGYTGSPWTISGTLEAIES